jgi:hypothetical protein
VDYGPYNVAHKNRIKADEDEFRCKKASAEALNEGERTGVEQAGTTVAPVDPVEGQESMLPK